MRKSSRFAVKKKRVRRSKKVIYKNVEYDSKLEVTMVMLLEDANIKFLYEKTYTLLEEDEYPNIVMLRAQRRSKAMADKRKMSKRVYTPDFIDPNGEWFIETKGYKNESFPWRWRMFLKLLKDTHGIASPMLFMPTNTKDCIQVVDILKKHYGS